MPNVFTGLKLPASYPVGQFPDFSTKYPSLSNDDIRAMLGKKQRSRERLPLSVFGKNQNPYSSCTSHGFTGTMERQYFAKTGKYLKMQPHFLYACINGGQDQGAVLADAAKSVMNTGVPAFKDAPDSSKIYLNQYDVPTLKPKLIKARELYEVRDEQSLLTALAMDFFCAVAIDVNDAFANFKQDAIAPYSTGPGNHCVCVDDAVWDEQLGGYKYNNPGSWGTNLGYQGYWWLTWKRHLAITTRYHVFYATPEIMEYVDDNPEPPAI